MMADSLLALQPSSVAAAQREPDRLPAQGRALGLALLLAVGCAGVALSQTPPARTRGLGPSMGPPPVSLYTRPLEYSVTSGAAQVSTTWGGRSPGALAAHHRGQRELERLDATGAPSIPAAMPHNADLGVDQTTLRLPGVGAVWGAVIAGGLLAALRTMLRVPRRPLAPLHVQAPGWAIMATAGVKGDLEDPADRKAIEDFNDDDWIQAEAWARNRMIEDDKLNQDAERNFGEAAGQELEVEMPPGKYFVGDPCWVLNWAKECHNVYAAKDGVLHIDGRKVLAFRVGAGDGVYLDDDDFRYDTTSQLIGMTPVEVLEDTKQLNQLGRVLRLEEAALITRSVEGVMDFAGEFTIDTSEPPLETLDKEFLDEEAEFEPDEDEEHLEIEDAPFDPTDANSSFWVGEGDRSASMELPMNGKMPAGEYFIGDPAYVLTTTNGYNWPKISEDMLRYDGLPIVIEGHKIMCYPTAQLDGVWKYEDDDGVSYEAPSGFLAMLPTSLLKRAAAEVQECGRIYKTQKEVVTQLSKEFTVRFGGIRIRTDTRVNRVEAGAVLPKGKYWIGDPFLGFSDDNGFDWESIEASLQLSETDFIDVEGYKVGCFYTCIPKGTFEDSDGHKYEVSSGMIALIPEGLLDQANWRQLAADGRVMEWDKSIGVNQDNSGEIEMGGIKIPTALEANGKTEYVQRYLLEKIGDHVIEQNANAVEAEGYAGDPMQ